MNLGHGTAHVGGEVLRSGSRIQRYGLFVIVVGKGRGRQRRGCVRRSLRWKLNWSLSTRHTGGLTCRHCRLLTDLLGWVFSSSSFCSKGDALSMCKSQSGRRANHTSCIIEIIHSCTMLMQNYCVSQKWEKRAIDSLMQLWRSTYQSPQTETLQN